MAWCAVDCAVFANNILLVSRSFMTIFSECVLLLCAEHKQAECRAHFAWKVKLYFYRKELLLTAYRFAPHWIPGRYSLDTGSILTGYRVDTHWIPGPYSLDIESLLTGYRELTHWISGGIHCVF